MLLKAGGKPRLLELEHEMATDKLTIQVLAAVE
jgi:hypothetical protein